MKKKTKMKLAFWAAFVLTLSVVLTYYINVGLRPNIMAQGETRMKNTALEIMNSSVREAINDVEDMDNLLQIEKNKEGQITFVGANSGKLNRIAFHCSTLAQERLEAMEETTINIPFGNLVGSKLFSGMGPKIRIHVLPMGAVTTQFHSEFQSAGINQTRHKLFIVLECTMSLVYGSTSQRVVVQSQVLISESIIVGVVPETFADVEDADEFMNLIP